MKLRDRGQDHRQGRRWQGRLLVLLFKVVMLCGLLIGTVVSLVPGPSGVPAGPVATAPDDDADGATPAGARTADPAVAAAESARVQAEDARLAGVTGGVQPGRPPFVLPGGPGVLPTTVLPARVQPYDLESLAQLGAAVQEPDGGWSLTNAVAVARGAQLDIEAPGGVLRLASGPAGFASIVAFRATVTLAGAAGAPLRITSWTGSGPDTRTEDGRAYIRAVGSRMDVRQVEVDALGFGSGRTSGLAWTGTATAPSTGSATGLVATGGHHGAYTSRVDGVTFTDSVLRGNALDGLVIRRGSASVIARNVTASDNGKDGISVARGAHDVTISDSAATGNLGDGIRIDGAPPQKAQATAAPAADDRSRGARFVVEHTRVSGNAGDGIVVSSADAVRLAGNSVQAASDAVTVRGPAKGVELTGNSLIAQRYGIAVTAGVTGASLHDNVVPAALVGVRVADSVTDLRDNTLTASRHAVALVGQAGGSVIGNHLAGNGLAAIDTGGLAPTTAPTVASNDETDWVVDRDISAGIASYGRDHPVLWLWLAMLVALVAAKVVTRRRRRRGAHRSVDTDQQVSAAEPVRLPEAATGPLPVIIPDQRPIEVGRGPDAESTAALPVTRVTLVSGVGAER